MDDIEYMEYRRKLTDLWFEKKAAADKLYHDAAMAGIGFEVAMVTAFGAPPVQSAAFHAVTIVLLGIVIPLYRKILNLDVEILEKEIEWLDCQKTSNGDAEKIDAADKATKRQKKKAEWWDKTYSVIFIMGLVSFALSAIVTMYYVSTQGEEEVSEEPKVETRVLQGYRTAVMPSSAEEARSLAGIAVTRPVVVAPPPAPVSTGPAEVTVQVTDKPK